MDVCQTETWAGVGSETARIQQQSAPLPCLPWLLTTLDRFGDRNPRGIACSRPRNREEVLSNSIDPDTLFQSPRDEAVQQAGGGLGAVGFRFNLEALSVVQVQQLLQSTFDPESEVR